MTELHGFEGSLFDPKEMERLLREYQQGCWYWHDDYLAYLYRDPQMRKAAPIAEGGRELIEQAKKVRRFSPGVYRRRAR